jgi:hypothetical protein
MSFQKPAMNAKLNTNRKQFILFIMFEANKYITYCYSKVL